MIWLRSTLFNVFLVLWTAIIGIVGIPFLLFSNTSACWVGKIWALVTIATLRSCCGIRYEIRGKEHLPETPYIIASKHQSAWETIIFLSILPKPAYVLKRELLFLPIYGQCVARMGMIAIDRSKGTYALKSLLKQAHKLLEKKRPIVIFPEGTRTQPGETQKYQHGIAALYSQQMAPVVPVALNSGIYWPKHSYKKYPGVITIQFLPPIYPGLTREVFMANLENAIETASRKLAGFK